MSKKSVMQSFVKERIEIPKVVKDKDGNAILLCPFCNPPHPLRADGSTSCGTTVRVQAVQTVYKAKYAREKMVCVKCGGDSGEMVSWQGTAYVHAHNCSPDVVTLAEPPKYSKLAEYAYKLPEWMKGYIETIMGKIMRVDEVTPTGQRTGVVLGYTFTQKKK